MTDDAPERPSTGGLVQALDVSRNAAIGAAVSPTLTVATYLSRVLEPFGPFADTHEYSILGPEGWFLPLAFVLTSATALLVTTVLTLVSAYRLSRTL